MSQFELALPVVLEHEGLLVDDTEDKGGPTHYGISLRYLEQLGEINKELADINHDGVIDRADILALTKEDAIRLYKTQWWDKYGYREIEAQCIATKVFDLSVNMGAGRAHRLVQRACHAVLGADNVLVLDGCLGPKTLRIVNVLKDEPLLNAIRQAAMAYYLNLNQPKYIAGWLKRARD